MKLKSFVISLFVLLNIVSNAQTISPYLVGTNLWYINPSAKVWSLTQQCGVQTIRIGGGEYDRHMPSKETILQWVKQIQAIDAEPIIQVSQYETPEKAAELVAYLNIENRGNLTPVKFWNIGNEPWLQAGRPPMSTFATVVAGYFKPIAAAMKAADSTLLIYGPDECDYMDYYEDLFGGKNDITVKVPGHNYYYCDGLSWHRYPQGNGDPATEGATDMYSRIVQVKTKVDNINALHNRKGKEALQWGLGEYNSKGGAEVHTWGNGQMFGAVLGWCMEYGATYATSWSMFEHGGIRKETDFSFIDGANMTPRASYRHMEFASRYFSGTFVKGSASNNDFIVFGAQDGERLSVMILNRAFGDPQHYNLYLDNSANSSSGLNLFINGQRDGVYKDIIQPRTTQVLIFIGDSITKINYSSDDFDKELKPSYSTAKMVLN